ncbi:uncharacterized protein Rsod [Lepeophtheirus salmonis]|uniref:uncharacterized protein Rsod n=1 Tax=Lepeophtheirus salmonis TaxID=72036 RepID=UPI001AE74E8B|nr:uncharacterized protein LOC121132268 [Lepeophtheirus salmonis]
MRKAPSGGFHNRVTKLLLLLVLNSIEFAYSQELAAHFSSNGLKGSIYFSKKPSEGDVAISLDFTTDKPGEYSWGIYKFPMDYSVGQENQCSSRVMGRKPEINLDDNIEKLVFENNTLQKELRTEFLSNNIGAGKESIWGKTLMLKGPDGSRMCSTIIPKADVRAGEAQFNTRELGGYVWFITVPGETRILTNLFKVENGKTSKHKWEIFLTDALDSNAKTCDFLQYLYDPGSKDDSECSTDKPESCKDGDLTSKFGEVVVGQRESLFTKGAYVDTSLDLQSELGSSRRALYLVIYDNEHPDSFLACTQIQNIPTKKVEAVFDASGVEGTIGFQQINRFFPVLTRISIDGLNGTAGGFHIHEFPSDSKMNKDDTPCSRSTGAHFNPTNIDASSSPPAGEGSFDQYEIGDLSGKYGNLVNRSDMIMDVWDPTISLFGKQSVLGRSMVIHEHPIPKRWICSNIHLKIEDNKSPPIIIAEAQFTYPIAGKIVFEQDSSNPNSDTSIFIQGLVYSDGTKNDTRDHDWHVHVLSPGKDFYNWTGRCNSAGRHFNPYKVPSEENEYNNCVNEKNPFKCQSGDLANKHGTIKISGRVRNRQDTYIFVTDSNLALSGAASIIGRSIVIHDKNAPKHRGNRLACTPIKRRYRHKTVAREWYGNGISPPPITGRLEFIQESENVGITHALIDLEGLDGIAASYHVHKIPLQSQLEFPCTGDAVGGHFNPFEIDPSQSPRNQTGTDDQYEIGDLSGKYGFVTDMNDIREVYHDTNLPLFGPNSIVGRSIVIHKKVKAARWACATLGWGFDPDEAREVRIVASFHHPNGFAWGYIRFRQVIYRDGSFTPAVMEVRLKYPGQTNKDKTNDHNWSIYVNPVGHDAAVEFQRARCTAAGYRWNPTHIQLADPLDTGFYSEECTQEFPWRCQVGDLGGKNGKISIGGKAYVIHDQTLQLDSGSWFTSAVGKSIVIHGPNGDGNILACANIEKDTDIIKYASIETKPRFNLVIFMEEVRAIMGVPEWFLFTDSRKTKQMGKCIQIQLHFTGPYANKMERDFARLLRTGRLSTPSIFIPGFNPDPLRKTKLGYKECDGSDSNGKRTQNFYYDESFGSRVTGNFYLLLFLSGIFWIKHFLLY